MTRAKLTSIGQLMTEKLETIDLSSSVQQASKKMRDKNVSSLIVVDDYNKPTGIVTERDLVRKVYVNDLSSVALVTIDAISSGEVAADIMMQNKVRHLLVVENGDINRPLGIITATDFVAYLKENLNIDDVNAKILAFIPDSFDVMAMVAIGKIGPKENLPSNLQEREYPSDRKPLSEILMDGRFRE